MMIQEQIHEWFNCSETLNEKLEILRALNEITEVLTTGVMENLGELEERFKKWAKDNNYEGDFLDFIDSNLEAIGY